MTDVRLTATTPTGEVVYVLANDKGELRLEEPIKFDGNLNGDLNVSGSIKSKRPNDFWNTTDYINVAGFGNLATQGSYEVDLQCNGYRNDAGAWTTLLTDNKLGAAKISLNPSGFITFGTEANKENGSDPELPTRMRIDPNGNVGIGIEVPRALLHISESVGSTTPAKMQFSNEGIRSATVGFDKFGGAGAGSPNFSISSGDQTIHYVNIDNSGNVGIGTEDASAKLDVDGDVVIGSRGAKWLIRESNGVAMLIEQTRLREKEPFEIEEKVRDLPNELDLVEAALNEVMTRLKMTPPAGWPVWDGSDIYSES
jgi:hypothetical protein